jgi:spore coat protein CotH
MRRRLPVFAICWIAALCSAADVQSPAFAASDLFQMNKIWNVHFIFTAEQFKAMQPRFGGENRSAAPGASWLQGSEGKRNGLASARGIEFNYAKAALDFEGVLLRDVGVRYKGNGTFLNSEGSNKLSLKVHFNEFVKGQKFAGVKTLNLHNQVTDASYMNEVLSYWLFRNALVPAPRTAYARVSITVPGQFRRKYLGLYVLTENIDERFFEERSNGKSGAIFKPVTAELFYDRGTDWKKYNQAYDPKTELTAAQKNRVFAFAKLLTNASDSEFRAKVSAFIDLEALARHMAVMMMLVNLDSILTNGQNYYMYLNPKTNLFEFLPWDQDHSFGQFNRAMKNTANLSIQHPWGARNAFLERMFAVPAFQRLYMARINEFNNTIFQPGLFAKQVDLLAPVLRPAVQEESSQRLGNFDKAAAGKEFDRPSSGILRGPSRSIKEFTAARHKSLVEQAAGRSVGELVNDFGFRR